MKKINSLFLLTSLILLSSVIVSCDDDEYSSSDLVGKWSLIHDKGYENDLEYDYEDEWDYTFDVGEIIFEFSKDGTCSRKATGQPTEYAEWKIKGSKLHLIYYDEEDEEEYEEAAKIISLTSTSLIIEYSEYSKDYEYYNKVSFQRMD